MNIIVTFISSLFFMTILSAQSIRVNINFTTKHSVGGVDTLNRSRFITTHSANQDGEWQGEENMRHYLLNDLDVYFGRETGVTSGIVFADTTDPGSGSDFKQDYLDDSVWLSYEFRQDLILCGQFWVYDGMNENGHYYGRQIGHMLNNYYSADGFDGQPTPPFFEMLNEPLWDLLDVWYFNNNRLPMTEEIEIINTLFSFHKDAANAARSLAPQTKYGGFGTAFPFLELNNFERWDMRWKKFIEMCGEYMDFYSIHLYDFPDYGGTQQYRKGGNMEAILDMITHYHYLNYGNIKPFVISEYGSQLHDSRDQYWSARRDWHILKAFSSMMIQFMDRPNQILKSIPFAISKGNWGGSPNIPYAWRLMRNTNEPNSFNGDWVWTEVIKFYQLWADVRGKRLETSSNDLDLQVDAYLDGNKAFLILNNIDNSIVEVNIDELGIGSNVINEVTIKHLHMSGGGPVLDTNTYSSTPATVTVGAEATMILQYQFASEVNIKHTVGEVKYFANTYKQPIITNLARKFNLYDIQKESEGSATLRIGVGRDHGLSLHPAIKINNTEVTYTTDYRGDDQLSKESFFGMLEIDIPFNLLQKNNEITIQFPDEGGFISSVALQVFNKYEGDVFIAATPLPNPDDLPFPTIASLSGNIHEINLYPNPARSFIYFEGIEPDNYNISIQSVQGTEHYRNNQIIREYTAVSVDYLPSGNYLVNIQNSKIFKTLKFSKID